MARALQSNFGQRVFWYNRQAELDLLQKNYLELIERTGGYPPRHKVEKYIFNKQRILQFC